MAISTRTLAAEPEFACGCGPDPGALARLGVFATLFLVLGGLTALILAGWLLGLLVWAAARWWRWWQGYGAVAKVEVTQAEAWEAGPDESFFARFGRWEEERPG
jgi:hypothetical protein